MNSKKIDLLKNYIESLVNEMEIKGYYVVDFDFINNRIIQVSNLIDKLSDIIDEQNPVKFKEEEYALCWLSKIDLRYRVKVKFKVIISTYFGDLNYIFELPFQSFEIKKDL